MTKSHYHAPRFHALFERLEGRSVLLMRRSEWERLRVYDAGPVCLDIKATPIARLAERSSVSVAVAERRASDEVVVSIYRDDPRDPCPINVDTYTVWESVPIHRDAQAMIRDASTSDNANLRGFLDDHIFMVKEPPGPDHWLLQLPTSVAALVKRTPSK